MHPVFLDLGPLLGTGLHLRIGAYGTFLLAALALGGWIGARAGRRLAPQVPWPELIGAMLATGVLVAKLFAVLEHAPGLAAGAFTWRAALTAGGHWLPGAIAGFGVGCLWLRRCGVPLGLGFNALVLAVSPAHALARVGCLLAGCCHGRPTELPWGIVYGDPLAHELQGTPLGVPLHPSPIYEALCEAFNFALCLRLARRGAAPWQVVATWAALYGSERFLLETLRGGDASYLGPLTTNQALGLALVLAGGSHLALSWSRGRRRLFGKLLPATAGRHAQGDIA